MDPARKRKIRLVVALSAAVLLAVGLVYTSFSASSEAKQPSDLVNATPGQTYQLTGVVVPGSIRHRGDQLDFRVADRDSCTPYGGTATRCQRSSPTIPVRYSGTVPDPFQDGREVIVTGRVQNGTFIGQRDSLVTKCPSKFSAQSQPTTPQSSQ